MSFRDVTLIVVKIFVRPLIKASVEVLVDQFINKAFVNRIIQFLTETASIGLGCHIVRKSARANARQFVLHLA